MNEETTESMHDARCPKCKGLMNGRHCLHCGYSRPEAREVEQVKPDAQERAEVVALNSSALVAVMQEYGITIPARDFATWRPTKRESGQLAGLECVGEVSILCTDGVVAHFLLADGQSTLHGHVANFSGDVKPLFSTPAKHKSGAEGHEKKARKPRAPKKDATALARELLETLLNTTKDLPIE